MKLAFVLFRFFPFGGMQRNMLAIAEACVARQHNVTIFCGEWQGEQPANMNIHCLPFSGWGNGAQMQSFYQQAEQRIAKESFDLVVGFNKFPGLDAYYAADSCFATKAYEDRGWLYRLSPRSKIYLRFENAVFHAASKTQILEVSSIERTQFQKYYQTPEYRFHSLNPGISPSRRVDVVDPEKIKSKRAELNIDDATLVFLAIGSGFKTKGLERSIQLLAEWKKQTVQSAVLLVAGQDTADSFLALAQRLGVNDNIQFLGGRNDIPDLLKIASVVLHPAYRENTGNVLLEAMIAGKPVIATEICGYAHYITRANMGVVLPKDFSTQDYWAAVNNVLSIDVNIWQERGRVFAQQPEIYSRPQQVAELLEQFYQQKYSN